MRVTLLISALNCDTDELIGKMHFSGDAVLVNQCDKDETSEINEGRRILIVSSKERGVGLSRNMCIDNSFGDILLFSDDDIVYDEDYEKKVSDEFEKHPEADMIMFNVSVCEERRTYRNEGFKKLSRLNIGRYPAYSIAVKRDVLTDKNVRFSELFGGGAKYSNGEDSLFLKDAYESGMAMYATETEIAKEIPRPSTWFEGYTEKFFFDRGVLFAFLYGKSAWMWRLRFVLTKKQMFEGKIKRKEANELMKAGIKEGFELIKNKKDK
ncbi:MAG: glycosyltransferase family 2 protein [Lachnospiraceae bacterium]|nr:glycosyltransferase family 2 protein [Lachnospiraceae bacterium]